MAKKPVALILVLMCVLLMFSSCDKEATDDDSRVSSISDSSDDINGSLTSVVPEDSSQIDDSEDKPTDYTLPQYDEFAPEDIERQRAALKSFMPSEPITEEYMQSAFGLEKYRYMLVESGRVLDKEESEASGRDCYIKKELESVAMSVAIDNIMNMVCESYEPVYYKSNDGETLIGEEIRGNEAFDGETYYRVSIYTEFSDYDFDSYWDELEYRGAFRTYRLTLKDCFDGNYYVLIIGKVGDIKGTAHYKVSYEDFTLIADALAEFYRECDDDIAPEDVFFKSSCVVTANRSSLKDGIDMVDVGIVGIVESFIDDVRQIYAWSDFSDVPEMTDNYISFKTDRFDVLIPDMGGDTVVINSYVYNVTGTEIAEFMAETNEYLRKRGYDQ